MPRKQLGQHYLADRGVAGRIVRAAHIKPGDVVVEVGPGRGALTAQLAASAGRLVLIEIDEALVADLRARFGDRADVALVAGDARRVDPLGLPGFTSETEYVLVGNLPYYAATPIIRNFIEAALPPTAMIVMVQREVAREMEAAPGKMSLLSVAVQLYADVEVLMDVPPEAFRPEPRVWSTVVRLHPLRRPRVDFPDSAAVFFEIVRAGFKRPRKQLHNSLADGLTIETPVARDLLLLAGIDSTRRAATVSLEEWAALHHAWVEAGRPRGIPGTPRAATRVS